MLLLYDSHYSSDVLYISKIEEFGEKYFFIQDVKGICWGDHHEHWEVLDHLPIYVNWTNVLEKSLSAFLTIDLFVDANLEYIMRHSIPRFVEFCCIIDQGINKNNPL